MQATTVLLHLEHFAEGIVKRDEECRGSGPSHLTNHLKFTKQRFSRQRFLIHSASNLYRLQYSYHGSTTGSLSLSGYYI